MWARLQKFTYNDAAERKRGATVHHFHSSQVITAALAAHEANPDLSPTKVFEIVSKMTNLSQPMVRTIISQFVDHGTLYRTETANRNRVQGLQVTDAHKQFLYDYIYDRLKTGSVAHRKDMLRALAIAFGAGVNPSFVNRLVKSMDLKYSKMGVDFSKYWNSDKRSAQIKRYVIQMDWALKEEAAGRGIVIYFDESYIDTKTHNRRGWHVKGKDRGAFPKGTGKRLVIMHCMTKHGLLAEMSVEGDSLVCRHRTDLEGGSIITKVLPNACVIFTLDKTKKDYHVTSELIKKYALNAVLPAVKALYPDKTPYFVLDNASSHYGRSGDNFNPRAASITKPQLVDRMLAMGCTSLRCLVAGEERTVDLTSPGFGNAKASKYNGVPNKPDLQDAAFKWVLARKPDTLLSDLQQWALKEGWVLVFAVPYSPEAMPIELVWQQAKLYVSSLYDGAHDTATIRQRVYDAFAACKHMRDGAGPVAGVNERCDSLIRRAMAYVDREMVPRVGLPEDSKVGALELPPELNYLQKKWVEQPILPYIAGAEAEGLAGVLEEDAPDEFEEME